MKKIPVVGDSLSIAGITAKGKQRCKQWGNNGWEVMQVRDEVQFSSKVGPWLFINPGDDRASRWIHATHDQDFEYIIVECNS